MDKKEILIKHLTNVYDALITEINKEADVQIQIDSHVINRHWTGDPKSDLALDPTDDIYDAEVFQVRFYALGDSNNDLLFTKEYYDLEIMAYDIIIIMDECPHVSIDEHYDLGDQFVEYFQEKKTRIKP